MEQTVASENLEMTSSLVRNDITLLALVVQKMDSTINQTNHYPLDKYQETRLCSPVDRDLSNRQPYPPFEPLGPDRLNKSDFFGIAIKKNTIYSYDTNWHPIQLYHNLFYFVLNYVTIQYENIWHPKYLFQASHSFI